jgi:glucan 1,3-beta-glucosidase
LIVAKIDGYQPNVVLDNVEVQRANTIVSDAGGVILEGGTKTIKSWVLGRYYNRNDFDGNIWVGDMDPPKKDSSLLQNSDPRSTKGIPKGSNTRFFEREKPSYMRNSATDFLNVLDFEVRNDGTEANRNTKGINAALFQAASQNKILMFPAGIYKVDDTLFIPPNSRIVGALWSQIMAVGSNFQDDVKPRILAK